MLLAVGERVKVIGQGLRSGQIAETGLKGPTGTLRS